MVIQDLLYSHFLERFSIDGLTEGISNPKNKISHAEKDETFIGGVGREKEEISKMKKKFTVKKKTPPHLVEMTEKFVNESLR